MKEKEYYIEYLRVLAMFLVILIHVVALPIQYNTVGEYGFWYMLVYVLGMAGVPLFLMISGALLLNPKRDITVEKVYKKMMPRIAIPLATWGTFFALIELLFNNKTLKMQDFPLAVWNMINGKSWAHLWYLYMLLGIYMLLPIHKIIINNSNRKMLYYCIGIMGVGGIVLLSLNNMFETSIAFNFPLPLCHTVYLYMGYLISSSKISKKKLCITWTFALLVFIVYLVLIYDNGWSLSNMSRLVTYSSLCVSSFSIAIFMSFKYMDKKRIFCDINVIVARLAEDSFGIYLIHPIFMNVFYKALNFVPTNFPTIVGIPVFLISFILPSFACVEIIRRIPYIRKII